ncbi:glyoxylate reductase [Coemansia reversa NRRL 1564]|uniref:Glyoxylate reductase n=1 Tax=Coemansia reversa (strain ATCC 12441 / NRRL 1564) TaxID=763665 RepID=A0A2G5B6A4_COERN|nr:glyoxylate reductase [Coemansia reversa NRRL 1564]|eukprot:PIA14522.1 glyoxylate reductase [Coemansia reversa NRRL 1564]
MSRPVLFVTRELPEKAQQRLENLTEEVEVRQHRSEEGLGRQQLLAEVRGAWGIICVLDDTVDAELVQAAGPQLRVVSTVSVGYDHVDTQALKTQGVLLGHTPGVLTDATADTTVLLALMAARRAKEALERAANGGSSGFSLTRGLGTQFGEQTLGIVGLGRIGSAVVSRLLPFGFTRVLYAAPRPQDKRAHALNAQHVSLETLLESSDLVCICCPLNPQTTGLFGSQAFARMRRSAILVNSARGAVVDHDALLDALDRRLIAHAALDVTVPEPLPAGHPLLTHPHCTVLPHIGSATEQTRAAMANLAIDNALDGIFARPLKAKVDL